MLFLNELHIDNFHLLEKSTVLTFNKNSNYLLGKNGTGKTTIIEIIRSFFTLDFSFFNDETDIIAIFRSKNDDNLSIKVKYSSFDSKTKDNDLTEALKSNLVDSKSKDETLRIEIHGQNSKAILEYYNGQSTLKINTDEEINLNSGNISRLLLVALIHMLENETNSYYEKIIEDVYFWFYLNSNIRRFSEGLENTNLFFNKNISVNIDSSNKLRVVNSDSVITSELLLKEKFFNIFLKIRNSLQSSEKDFEENIVISKDDSNTISVMANFLNVDNVRLNFKVGDINYEDEKLSFILGEVRPSIVLKNGKIIDYKKLSYGEKRMFHLILSFFENKSTVLLDEPVNGFHDEFIDKIIKLSTDIDAQIFIANQNPILFDYIEVENETDFISKFIFCKTEHNKMNWNNPSQSEANNFIEHYESEFFHVSKILKKIKLW